MIVRRWSIKYICGALLPIRSPTKTNTLLRYRSPVQLQHLATLQSLPLVSHAHSTCAYLYVVYEMSIPVRYISHVIVMCHIHTSRTVEQFRLQLQHNT